MNEKISFGNIISTFAQNNSVSKTFARSFVKEMAAAIEQGLLRDSTVNLNGLGIFKLHNVQERTGRNIQTGETITIAAHRKVLFKPEKQLRELINKNYQHLRPTLLNDEDDTELIGDLLVETPSSSESKPFDGAAEELLKPKPDLLHKEANEKKSIVETPIPAEEPKTEPIISSPQEEKPSRTTPIIITIIIILTILFIYFQFGEEDAKAELKTDPVEKTTPLTTKVQEENIEQTQQPEKIIETPPPVKEEKPERAKTHKAEDGDNLWKLANKYFNDGYLWPLILLENKDNIQNPDFIQSGIQISLPSDSKINNSQQLAKAHLLAYQEYKKENDDAAINHLQVAYKYDKEIVKSFAEKNDDIDIETIKKLSKN